MNTPFVPQQTFAAWVPTCKTCGATDTTIVVDQTTLYKSKLRCGHPADFVLIPNPKLPK